MSHNSLKNVRTTLINRILSTLTILFALNLFATTLSGQDLFNPSFQPDEYANTIRPLLDKYCANCHAPGEMEGLEFLIPRSIEQVKEHSSLFADVVEQLETGAMPPGDDQPSDMEREKIVSWLKQNLELTPADTQRIAQYVVNSFQDSKGNLWFGTMRRGVARYDGNQLVYFDLDDGLPSLAVPSFAEDKDGTLWVGTQNGVCRFDGQRFVRLGPEFGFPARSQDSPQANGQVFSTRAGEIWICLSTKVYRMVDGKPVTFRLPAVEQKTDSFAILPGAVSVKLEDRQGNLWFSVDGYGVYRYDGRSFKRFTKSDGLCSNNVTEIIEDQQGRLWFTCMQSFRPEMTGDGGLCRFDGETFETFPTIKGLANNDLYSMLATRSGQIWIGATGVGAYRYDGQSFKLFSETDQPHRTRYFGLQSIMEDREGTLWFGFSGGLFRFNGSSFYNVTPQGPWKRSAINKSEAAQQFRSFLVAPAGWLEEVIECPPSFAPTMSIKGWEHLRLPREYRDPASDWFMSYLFAIELSQPFDLNKQTIEQQLLLYYRGLANGAVDQQGQKIDTSKFRIAAVSSRQPLAEGEYQYLMTWQEPFAGGRPLKQTLRVKVISRTTADHETQVLFVCGSPQPETSEVWRQLLGTREQFEQRWRE